MEPKMSESSPYVNIEHELSKSTQVAARAARAAQDVESCAPLLVGTESYEWAAISNLDVFFARVYRYWHGRGLLPILVSGLLNIAVLAFTIAFSGFLLIFVNWGALAAGIIFGLYWIWTLSHFAWELRGMAEVKHFMNNKLGVSERQVGMMTWAEVVHKIVLIQRTTRLSIARDLNEHYKRETASCF
eukprot:gene1260-32608_t